MTDAIRTFDGGVTSPRGYVAAGIHTGVRKVRKDLAMLVSSVPAAVAGVFTMNKAQAAPVLVDKAQLKHTTTCSAVVVNSGNANACTGERGLNDAWAMVRTAAAALAIPEDQVLISSTGVIGQYLPMEKILPGISRIAGELSVDGGIDAAEAIMTTDTYSKQMAVAFDLDGREIRVGVMAKGSGMICPNMATMLAFVTTDLAIAPHLLQKALSEANEKSFNRISVDGDTSTNDMVLLMANGMAGNPIIESEGEEFALFASVVEHLLIEMAKKIARDGEGATKLIEVVVRGAATLDEAEAVARAVANSNLVKTAIHGQDANWGRIIAAVGYAGVEIAPENVEIDLNGLPVLGRNYQILLDEERAKEVLALENITIGINLNQGDAMVNFWTCDLTKEYVHINASYRS